MNPIESAPVGSRPAIAPPVFPPAIGEPSRAEGPATLPKPAPRRRGYGLPCAKCKTYYAADLTICPVCNSSERVAPLAKLAGVFSPVASPAVEELPIGVELEANTAELELELEKERERFLQEFKSQAYAPSLQVNPAPSFLCANGDNHQGASEAAEVCQGCYDGLRQRADLAEAALHLDVNEATQIIYEAVWSDASNPGKTYQNAAQALLNELRRRAGISMILAPLQTLTD
jgi:hypothetical protein